MQSLVNLEMKFRHPFYEIHRDFLSFRRGNLLAGISIDLRRYFDYRGKIEIKLSCLKEKAFYM